MADEVPWFMTEIQAGVLDRRVLDQAAYWVTGQGTVLCLAEMSTEHLENVLAMLGRFAQRLHLDAMLDLFLDETGRLMSAEKITYDLTGSAMHTASAEQWLEGTDLVRSIRRELARRQRRP